VTTSTVAALLTILGYSLYDTIIVFDRVRENVPRMPRAAFSQIVNRSMSEVITRSLATSFCTLLPVVALLLFGGSTLKDFAFALLVGVASGAYSSIFIASPVLTHWKEREPIYKRRHDRIASEHGGLVPAYAAASAAEDVEPVKRRRRRSISAERPDAQLSHEEFQELVADIQPEVASTKTAAPPKPEPSPEPEAERDPAADLTPDDVVMPKQPSAGGPKGRARNRRHGRR
jgi:SecD/SecF fusion protein